jgi:hypothetical protein
MEEEEDAEVMNVETEIQGRSIKAGGGGSQGIRRQLTVWEAFARVL